MKSCAFEKCNLPTCVFCTVDKRLPPAVKCGRQIVDGRGKPVEGRFCQVTGPHDVCRQGRKVGEKDDGSDELQKRDLDGIERDGDTAPKGGDNLAFKKRERKGPHR